MRNSCLLLDTTDRVVNQMHLDQFDSSLTVRSDSHVSDGTAKAGVDSRPLAVQSIHCALYKQSLLPPLASVE